MAAQTETVVVTESVTSQEEQETPRAESSEEGERREAGEKASVSGSVEHEGGDKGFLKGLRRRNGPKSRRPPSNKWLQQQIPACRPVFTAKHVFALFLVVGIVFVVLGIVFVAVTVQLRDVEVEYTDCGPLDTDNPDTVRIFSSCEDYLKNQSVYSNVARREVADREESDCHCRLNFTVEKTIRYPWKFYYALDNYYQNHRRYLNSWDPSQLRGGNFHHPDSNCRPLLRYKQDGENSSEPVTPCGLIANSWFNDSFYYLRNDAMNLTVDLSRNNIAWQSDREVRFQNPSNLDQRLDGTNMPPNWLYNLSSIDGGLENESFIVWYRVSAFPWFRKLYAHPRGEQDLPPGDYSMLITYNYPVDNFHGHKSIVISELSWLGGPNLFLGIAYIITGAVCIVLSVVLLIVHLFFSKWKISDANFLKRSY